MLEKLAEKMLAVFGNVAEGVLKRPVDNIFGLINSKFKRGIETREFKVREKDVSKNKVGSIIRGTFEKNDQLINEITKELNIKYVSNAKNKKETTTTLNVDKNENENENENENKTFTLTEENDQASITGALPTLVEMLIRYKNDTYKNTVSFLNIETFDFFRKYTEQTAIKNW